MTTRMSQAPARAMGATIERGGVTFRAFATTARAMDVRLFDRSGAALETLPMTSLGDGLFEVHRTGCGAGTRYKLVLRDLLDGSDAKELPDPYARFLPQGVHGPAEVVPSDYAWRAQNDVTRPLSEHVIYEIHVGTFTAEGTYAAARGRLPALVDLGVTAVELMPLAAFAGERGWGYDGVALYAPFAPYGTPDDLRAFVDEAHRLGLSVFLDVVYNHFGPAGNYLAAYAGEYFTSELHNLWGDAPNYAHPAMRRYVLDNAAYWLNDFRFDGLRLDAVHAIVDRLDRSERHVLRELSDLVASMEPRKLLIGEDDRNDPASIEVMGLDAVWADDFHHTVRVTLTGEQDGYYRAYPPGVAAMADAINGGWLYDGTRAYAPSGKTRGKPAGKLVPESFVYCIQNHDQVGNRALGDRLSAAVSLDAYLAASMLLLFLPMTPLLFMGQEWAATTPFRYFTDHEAELGEQIREGRRTEFQGFAAFSSPEARNAIPDPQAVETFSSSKLDWNERNREPHARAVDLYRTLLALRKTDPVLREASREHLRAAAREKVLSVERWLGDEARHLLVNFSQQATPIASVFETRDPRNARLLLSSSPATTEKAIPPWSAALFTTTRT